MKLIQSADALKQIIDDIQRQSGIIIPIYSDARRHERTNKLCLMGIFLRSTKELVVIPFDHPDVTNAKREWFTGLPLSSKTYTPDKKSLSLVGLAGDIWDIGAIEYLESGSVSNVEGFYSPLITHMHQKFYGNLNVNRSIPIYKWIEVLEKYGSHLDSIITENTVEDTDAYRFLNNITIPTLVELERSGLKIDPEEFPRHFKLRSNRYLTDGMVYSRYNPYTTTGRPSCKFGGVNFAALNKSDGSRSSFVSRYDNGSLILMDFESYHVRIIADLIGYNLPTTEPSHMYFARKMYGDVEITEEMYSEAKQHTFQQLYSDAESNLEYFQKVSQFKKLLWEEMEKNGYITSPISGKKIYLDRIWNVNSSKVFNYLVQLLETENNMKVLHEVATLLRSHDTKMVLYNYDSLLLDVPEHDRPVVRDIAQILSQAGKYPLRTYVGDNFDNMVKI